MFQSNDLKAFMATDSGLCYNSKAHFDSVAEILSNGESDLCQVNTFYGKVNGDLVELLYSPKSNNIDVDSSERVVSMSFNKSDFEKEFLQLISRVNAFFSGLKSALKSGILSSTNIDLSEEVFNEISMPT